jgi:hypothetical protein
MGPSTFSTWVRQLLYLSAQAGHQAAKELFGAWAHWHKPDRMGLGPRVKHHAVRHCLVVSERCTKSESPGALAAFSTNFLTEAKRVREMMSRQHFTIAVVYGVLKLNYLPCANNDMP